MSREPAAHLHSVSETTTECLLDDASRLLHAGFRLALVAAHDDVTALRVVYVFTKGPLDERIELVLRLNPDRLELPSLAKISFVASRFEREMRDLFGVIPLDHPQPRRLVLHQHWPEGYFPMRHDAGGVPPMIVGAPSYPFIPVEGPGVYEIPVGPVHAGLIEPGHFRFFVVGETILRMKARLWFVHKGIEKLMEGLNIEDGFQVAQRISGDSAVGHGLAFMTAVEEALGQTVSLEDAMIRGALLEMERLYNHVGDLGGMCNDVGFSIANSQALTLRERLLRLNEDVTGHRLLRDGVSFGGVRVRRLPNDAELDRVDHEVGQLVAMVRANALVMDRFAGTAVLSHDDALDMGTLGVVARASGCSFDARVAHPFTAMAPNFNVVTLHDGDVLARFDVRVGEIHSSLESLRYWSSTFSGSTFPQGQTVLGAVERDTHEKTRSGLGLIEGWRGTIAQRVELDNGGGLTRVKIVDPSFFNWPAFPISLADTIIPDFPLANKSFNLSYAGNDL